MSQDYALSGRYVGQHRREFKGCYNCHIEFTWNNRQHHCRACGEPMCSACLGTAKLPLRHAADLFADEREKAWPYEAGRPKECAPGAPRTVWAAEPQACCPACSALICEESRKSLQSAMEDQEMRLQRDKQTLQEDLNDAMALLKQHGIEFHSRMSFLAEPCDISFSQGAKEPASTEREPRVSGHGHGG